MDLVGAQATESPFYRPAHEWELQRVYFLGHMPGARRPLSRGRCTSNYHVVSTCRYLTRSDRLRRIEEQSLYTARILGLVGCRLCSPQTREKEQGDPL